MSSDFSRTLPQLLPRHRRQVVLLVIRHLAFPQDEDDLHPLRAQCPKRLVMRVAPRPLLVVVRPGPLTRAQREERHLIDHVPQRRVAGEAEVDDLLFAAPLGHGHGAADGVGDGVSGGRGVEDERAELDVLVGLDLPDLDWGQLWPVILIAIGAWIVLTAMRQRAR